jgi:hypothetical protein
MALLNYAVGLMNTRRRPMSSITTYALKLHLITSEDGSRYYKATTRFGDKVYTAIGVSPHDARESLMNKLLLDTQAAGFAEVTDGYTEDGFTELPPPSPRMSEVIRLVLLWGVLAFIVCGLMAIVAKILTN